LGCVARQKNEALLISNGRPFASLYRKQARDHLEAEDHEDDEAEAENVYVHGHEQAHSQILVSHSPALPRFSHLLPHALKDNQVKKEETQEICVHKVARAHNI
jgi:hypothetical protein